MPDPFFSLSDRNRMTAFDRPAASIVINIERGFFLRHDVGHALYRSAALFFVAVELRNTSVVPVLLE